MKISIYQLTHHDLNIVSFVFEEISTGRKKFSSNQNVTHNIWTTHTHWSLLPKCYCYKEILYCEHLASYPLLWVEEICKFKKMLINKSET